MADWSDLKRLAEAATPGPWGRDGSYICPARTEDGTTYIESWRAIADAHQLENARFIAAANPAAILALVAENEALKQALSGPHDVLAKDLVKELVDNAQAILENSGDGEDEFYIVLMASAERLRRQEAKIDQLRAENERLREDVKDHADARAHYCGKVGEIAGERDQLAERLRMFELIQGGRASELVSEAHALRAEVRRLKILAGEPVPPLPEEFVGPMPESCYARLRRKLQEGTESAGDAGGAGATENCRCNEKLQAEQRRAAVLEQNCADLAAELERVRAVVDE